LEACGRVLVERAHQHVFESVAEVGAELSGPRGHGLHVGAHHVELTLSREGAPPGQHLVEQDAQRVGVGLNGPRLAAHLLGRHVLGCTHQAAGAGRALAPVEARDSEVDPLRLAARADHQVGGLDVAMHHAGVVRVLDPVERLMDQRERLLEGQRAAPLESSVQCLALDEFHHQVEIVVFLGEGEHDGDVGMVESRQSLGFHPEALDQLGVIRQIGAQHLDRHGPPQGFVDAAPDEAHGSAADLLADQVVADSFAGPGRAHGYSFPRPPRPPRHRAHRPSRGQPEGMAAGWAWGLHRAPGGNGEVQRSASSACRVAPT
jgi:hypothetical protein